MALQHSVWLIKSFFFFSVKLQTWKGRTQPSEVSLTESHTILRNSQRAEQSYPKNKEGRIDQRPAHCKIWFKGHIWMRTCPHMATSVTTARPGLAATWPGLKQTDWRKPLENSDSRGSDWKSAHILLREFPFSSGSR